MYNSWGSELILIIFSSFEITSHSYLNVMIAEISLRIYYNEALRKNTRNIIRAIHTDSIIIKPQQTYLMSFLHLYRTKILLLY